jgi:hypothetical protein
VLRFQRHNYLHENLVRSGLVWEPWHYKYRSTVDYYTNENGLVSIAHVDTNSRHSTAKLDGKIDPYGTPAPVKDECYP